MQAAVGIPILNIVEETKKAIQAYGYKTVGLLASESTIKMGLYQKYFAATGIKVIAPNAAQQPVLNGIIERVMGGHQGVDDVIALKKVARSFAEHGAQAVVLGCTEIPMAINQAQTDIKLLDTIDIIVRAAVDFSLANHG